MLPTFEAFYSGIDNFPYRQIFDLGKSRQRKRNSRKEPFKVVKFQDFVAKSCKIRKI